MRDWLADGSSSTPFPFITLSSSFGTGWSPKPCLVHWGMSGRAGFLIYLSDHHSPLWGCYCVLSLFIKVGLNGLFAELCACREIDQGDVKGHMRPWMNMFPPLLSPTQQVQLAKKKAPFNREKAPFQYLVSEKEKWKDREGRGVQGYFRGCDLDQQPHLFCIVKLFLVEKRTMVVHHDSPNIIHIFQTRNVSKNSFLFWTLEKTISPHHLVESFFWIFFF